MSESVKPDGSEKIRVLGLIAVTLFVWLVLGMVYTEHFFPPFKRLEVLLMPWKELQSPGGESNLDQRLANMQARLERSARTDRYALAVTLLSFAAFSAYLSILYQQKRRRARENMLLTLKNREIARRNEFIRYISATIGHEFKNNLGRIKRRMDLIPDIPGEARERINGNMEKLFADIDIFKKISDEREAGLIEFRNVYLKSLIEELRDQYADLADISIEERSLPLPVIYAAPPLLRTVFENVIDNAVKYKKPEQPRARIYSSCALDNDGGRRYVTVSLRDEGLGMNEIQADSCFYKGKGTRESWGQGLYYTKYVVGLHAGKIRIGKEYTAPGVGAEVIIQLPFVEERSDV